MHGRVPLWLVFEEHIQEVASIRGIAFKEGFPDSTTIR